MKLLLLLCTAGLFLMAGTASAQMPGSTMTGGCSIPSIFVVDENTSGECPTCREHQTYGLPCYFNAGVVVLFESSLKQATDPTNWSDVLVFTTGGVNPQPGAPALTATYISDTEDATGHSNGITDDDLSAAGLPLLHVSDIVSLPNTVYLQENASSFDNYYDAKGPDGRVTAYDLRSDPAESDFLIFASPNSVTLDQGTSGNSTISTVVTTGLAEPVLLSVSGLPTGASAGFSPASVTSGKTSTLTINAGTAAPGTYPLTVSGTGFPTMGGTGPTHTTNVSLTITAPVPASPTTWGRVKGRYRVGS